MMHIKKIVSLLTICLSLLLSSGLAWAAEKKSADQVAKELANPAGSLASLNFNLQYTEYTGDLPESDDQNNTSLIFQPTLPFLLNNGNKIIFRPAMSVSFDQPIFNADKMDFDTADTSLTDTTFDLVYAGTVMTDKKEKKGYLWGVGLAGTLPTATDDDLAGDQWRAGPEFFAGIIRKWGLVGALVSNQWNFAGSNDDAHSVLNAQYFYAYGLGGGWQLASSPIVTYDWHADSDDALTLPVGFGVAKTAALGEQHWKFQLQVQKYLVQPDTFGPDWLVKFTVTPVIKNPFAGLF
jgi:hypothetical protein